MGSNKPKFIKFCTEHKEEPILRVSLDAAATKIFYCYDCLEGLDNDVQSKLVKFSEFVDKLHEQIPEPEAQPAEETKENPLVSFAADKDNILIKLDGFISQQKQRVDDEFGFLENEMKALIKSSKTNAQNNLENLQKDFEQNLVDYLEKVNIATNSKTTSEKVVTKEELHTDLLSDENVEEIEKKVRKLMDKIETIHQIKGGRVGEVLSQKKKNLEDLFNSSDLVLKKDPAYYKQKLEILSAFLETIVFKSDDSAADFSGAVSENMKAVSNKLRELFLLPSLPVCSLVANNGEVEDDHYMCKTCVEAIGDVEEDLHKYVAICQECKDTCHKGHNVVKLATGSFRCSCQFFTKHCKFAKTCTFKYTGENPSLILTFKCKTDGLSSSEPLCHFCATVCHKDHVIKEKGFTTEGFCVCSQKFDFCKLNQENQEIPNQ